MDLSQRGGGLRTEVGVCPAAELLMSLVCLSGEEELSDYDLGAPRLEKIRSTIPAELLVDVASLVRGFEKVPGHLLGLVFETPEPRGVASFIDTVAATDALAIQMTLLGFHMRKFRSSPQVTIRAAAAGDAAAQKQLLADTADWPEWTLTLENLFELGPDRVKALLVKILPWWNEVVFEPHWAEARPALERSAEAAAALARTLPPEALVEKVTNGIQHLPDPGLKRLVFWPTYWLKPWVLMFEHREVKIFCFSVSDDHLEADSLKPPPGMVKLFKALGDEGRLRLLRRLGGGPITLADAAEELGVAKSTAHHHISLLRQAGLVWIREDPDNKMFGLRRDLVPEASRMLESYLGGDDRAV